MRCFALGLFGLIMVLKTVAGNMIWLENEALPAVDIELNGHVHFDHVVYGRKQGDIWFRRFKTYVCCTDYHWLSLENKTKKEIIEYYKTHFESIEVCNFFYTGYNFAGNYNARWRWIKCHRWQGVAIVLYLMKTDGGLWFHGNLHHILAHTFLTVRFYSVGNHVLPKLDKYLHMSYTVRCYTNWYGPYCNLFCDPTANHIGVHSFCREGRNYCLHDWTGLEQRINYKLKKAKVYIYEPKIYENLTIFSCDVMDLCSKGYCGENTCFQHKPDKYFCDNWVKPILVQTRYYFYQGNYISCSLVSQIKHLDVEDLPMKLQIGPISLIEPSTYSLAIGKIVGEPGMFNVDCVVDGYNNKIKSKTKIQIISYISPCDVVERKNEIIHYLEFEEVIHIISTTKEMVPEMHLQFSKRAGDSGTYLQNQSLRFDVIATPGIYSLSCILFRPKIDKSHVIITEFILHLIGESDMLLDPEVVELGADETFSCLKNTSYGRHANSATLNLLKRVDGIKIVGNASISFMSVSQGEVLLRCVFSTNMGKRSSRHKLHVIAIVRNLTIQPEVITINSDLNCIIDGPIAVHSYRIFWEIYTSHGVLIKTIQTQHANLVLLDENYTVGGNLTLLCKMQIFVRDRIIILEKKQLINVLADSIGFTIVFPVRIYKPTERLKSLFIIIIPLLMNIFFGFFVLWINTTEEISQILNWRLQTRLTIHMRRARKRVLQPAKKKRKKSRSRSKHRKKSHRSSRAKSKTKSIIEVPQ